MRSIRFLIACACMLFAAAAHAQSFPPSPNSQIAVNPVTNKVYSANGDSNTVTVFNVKSGTMATIPVGRGANYIAVNTATNRIYVNNGRDASLTEIDGASDTVLATYPIGSVGPIAVNAATNVLYIVRLTGSGTGEATLFNANTSRWYSISTSSSRTNAIAVNPVTNRIYVSNHAGGDIRSISASYNESDDFPATVSIPVHRQPVALAVNPVTNRVYVVTDSTTQPLAIINGATNTATMPAITPGRARLGQSVIVNPVTNKAYAAFADEIVVIDGSGALTYIPIAGASSGVTSLGIDYGTNRIYALNISGSLNVIDGDSNTVLATLSLGAGANSISVNPVNHALYYYRNELAGVGHSSIGGTERPTRITTTINPLPGNSTPANGSITMTAASSFTPTAPPVRKVYFQIDSKAGQWLPASGNGPFTAPIGDLPPGSHTIHAFAVDGQDAALATGPQSNALIGTIASYTFNVTSIKTTPSVSLSSSRNPADFNESLTFTASVAGSSGTPTGSVDFKDGDNMLCAARPLASGTASCTIGGLSVGTHEITAVYSGNASYDPATSGRVSQRVKPRANLSATSSRNPALTGESITFTISANGSLGTPTGTVTMLTSNTPIAGCTDLPLVNGTASCSTSSLPAGRHYMSIGYSGDNNYATYGATTFDQVVNQNLNTATVSLVSSANPSTFGEAVTFTATISGGAGSATGTVAFRDDNATLYECASVAVASGTARCTIAGLAPGAHSITAAYSGDASYNPRTSAAVAQNVQGGPPAPPRAWKFVTTGAPPLTFFVPQNVNSGGPRTAVDGAGNLYLAAVRNSQGTSCMVYLKYSANGQAAWERQMCQPNNLTFSGAIAIDPAGNVLVTGAKGGDLYVARLSSATGEPQWERQIEGPDGGGMWGLFMGLDASGNPRIAGFQNGTITVYAVTSADGTTQWVRTLDRALGAKLRGFTVDAAGNSFVHDQRQVDINENFDVGVTRIDSAGNVSWRILGDGDIKADAAGDLLLSVASGLQKRSAASGALLWTQPIAPGQLAIDAQGNTFVTGRATVGFDADYDLMTAKVSPGGQLLWRNVLVDADTFQYGTSIAIDAAGDPIVSGLSSSAGGAARQISAKYASGDGRIVWLVDEADAQSLRNHSVHAVSGGAVTVGTAYPASGGETTGLYAIRYGNSASTSGTVDLAITQSSAPNPAGTGKDVVFTLAITNNGSAAASGVNVTDTLPAGATFVWASQGCTAGASTVTCALGSLASGASRTVKVVVRPTAAGTATNVATVTAAQADTNTANNTATANVTVGTSPTANLVVRYRLYSPVTQEHLFTTDRNEYDTLGAQTGTWQQEGESGRVLDNPGAFNGVQAVPYYRVYNTQTQWHHWTTDANEYYTLIQFPQYNAEGVDGYILPTNTAGATQLYRLLYPDGRGLHHWTIDANEYQALIATYGWVGEGGSGFVVK